MAQVKFQALTNEWTSFASVVGTVGADTTYQIQSRGADVLVALESASEPTGSTQAGVMVLPNNVVVYKKGTQDLYLRAFNSNCSINVTSED